jgi:hypothetical protein
MTLMLRHSARQCSVGVDTMRASTEIHANELSLSRQKRGVPAQPPKWLDE